MPVTPLRFSALLALALATGTPSADILAKAGVTPQSLNTAIETIRKGRTADSPTAENAYDALKKYARDLTEAAREGKLERLVSGLRYFTGASRAGRLSLERIVAATERGAPSRLHT